MNIHLAYILGRLYRQDGNIVLRKTQKKFLNLIESQSSEFSELQIREVSKKITVQFKLSSNVNLNDIILDYVFSSHFIQGLYEGTFCKDRDKVILPCDVIMAENIVKISQCKGYYDGKGLVFVKHNALDLLHYVYSNPACVHYSKFCYKKYCDLADGLLSFKYTQTKEAVAPFKSRASDSGYDLTLISVVKSVGNTTWYSTGITLEPPTGYYFDLVPRSSLSKTGYILANSIGIIDRSYTGDIIVALTKIDSSAKDLELPFRAVQIIPRRIIHLDSVKVDCLLSSNRADSGFGSSN